jgi:CRISPR-associated protein Csm4
MKTVILKTKPYSLFRLGSGSKDDVDLIIHSDTLFSAIISMHSQVFDNTNKLLELFKGNQIKISSAFHLLSDAEFKKKIIFLPKPELDYSYTENIKAEKKIKFISFKVWKDIIAEKNNAFSFSDKAKYTRLNEIFVCHKDELDTKDIVEESDCFISKEVTAKTKVHSLTQEDSFYHETNIQLLRIKLKNESTLYPHFYFFLDSNCEEKYLEEVYTCLRLLADEGIGGERSSGKGHIDKVIIGDDIEFPEVSNPKSYFTISLTNPMNQQEFDNITKYNIIIRGGGSVTLDDENESYGYDTTPFRKKQVRMILEGALVNNMIQGRLVDISPDVNNYGHKFYRNGKCFLLPIG